VTVYKLLIVVLLSSLLSACLNNPFRENTKYTTDNNKNFDIKAVVKTDIDMVVDRHVGTLQQALDDLMLKLYLRNPKYWRLDGFTSAKNKVLSIGATNDDSLSKKLNNKRSIDSIRLAFENDFKGDRVLAFVFGLKSMLRDSYGGRDEFYLMDQLDPQKLYNAARNIEVAVWMLSNERDDKGDLYLISNELKGTLKNLSFERLFGKLIALQDSSAYIVADSTNRTIKNVIQGLAGFVFLPI